MCGWKWAYAHYSGLRSFLKWQPISVLPWSVLTEVQNLEHSYCFIKIVLTPAPLQFLAAAWVTSPPLRRLVNCDLLSVTDFEDPRASPISKRKKKKNPLMTPLSKIFCRPPSSSGDIPCHPRVISSKIWCFGDPSFKASSFSWLWSSEIKMSQRSVQR